MPTTFIVAGWLVQPSLNRLTRDSLVVRLEPKVMQVLICLAETPGEVVSREALIARVWPDVFVSDDVLHRAVRELRRVFQDDAARPLCIETIRKRGYRLIAPVQPGTMARPDAAIPAGAPPRPRAPAPAAAARSAAPVTVAAAAVLVAGCAFAVSVLLSRPAAIIDAQPRFVALTGGTFNEIDPAIAPDGRRVVFVRRESSDDTGQADLFLTTGTTRAPQKLTATPADERLPAWSPDGRRLAFLRVADGACDVVIRSIDDGAEQTVTHCPNRQEPRIAWAGDGGSLVVSVTDTTDATRPWRLAVRSLTTGAVRMLTSPPDGIRGDHSPVVSPDGGTVAFVRHATGGIADVFVVPVMGGVERRLTHDEADLEGLAWTDNGRAVVISSDRAGGYTLWRVPVEGGSAQLLAGGASRLKHPIASRNGGRIAYENWSYEINIWAQSGVDRSRPVTQTSDLWNYYPQISPDGSRVVYVSTASGSQELWVANADGSSARQLTTFDRRTRGAALRMPRWSPDGRGVALVVYAGASSDLFLVDAATGATEAIAASDRQLEVAPSWSADGTEVYAGVRTGNRWDIWAHPVGAANRQERPRLIVPGGYAAQTSSDGEWLFFTYASAAGLWRQPTSGGDAERVIDDMAAGDWANWHVTPRGVFRVVMRGDAPVVEQLDFDGQRPRIVAALQQLSWPGISVTDGGEVLYARWDRRQSRIMLLESSF